MILAALFLRLLYPMLDCCRLWVVLNQSFHWMWQILKRLSCLNQSARFAVLSTGRRWIIVPVQDDLWSIGCGVLERRNSAGVGEYLIHAEVCLCCAFRWIFSFFKCLGNNSESFLPSEWRLWSIILNVPNADLTLIFHIRERFLASTLDTGVPCLTDGRCVLISGWSLLAGFMARMVTLDLMEVNMAIADLALLSVYFWIWFLHNKWNRLIHYTYRLLAQPLHFGPQALSRCSHSMVHHWHRFLL